MSGFFENVGEYWKQDNAAFEETNPSLRQRVVRSLNPMTSFGSALGSMHTSAGRGDIPGMSLSMLEALPLFGTLKTVATAGKGLTKGGVRQSLDWNKFLAALGVGAGAALGNDAYSNSQDDPKIKGNH